MEHKLHVKFFFRIVRFLSSIAFFDLLLIFFSFFLYFLFFFIQSIFSSGMSRSDPKISDRIRTQSIKYGNHRLDPISVFRIFEALKYYFFVYIFNMCVQMGKKKKWNERIVSKVSNRYYGYIYILVCSIGTNWNIRSQFINITNLNKSVIFYLRY